MLEAFFLQNHSEKVESQWRQKTLISSEILGRAAYRYMRPEIIGDRTRLDLMWNSKTLGVRGPTKDDGTYVYYALSKPDSTHPGIVQMMEEFEESQCPLQFAQIRFRYEPTKKSKGIWIDTSNEQIKSLLDEPSWVMSLLEKKWIVEAGQKHKEFGKDGDGIKFKEAKARPWLQSFNLDNEDLWLKSYVSLFSQPGPESNRALIAAGFDLLDEANIKKLSWAEWGAGYGNLSAAFDSRLGHNGSVSELEAAAFDCLEENQQEYFPKLKIDCRAAEKGPNEKESEAELWLLDPPRSGFQKLLETMLEPAQKKPKWILAYHCHTKGLMADSKILRLSGFHLKQFTSVDIFPATPHHEVVSLWEHK